MECGCQEFGPRSVMTGGGLGERTVCANCGRTPPSTHYICSFYLLGEIREVALRNGISSVSHGFWVDDNLQPSYERTGKYWVPPHKVEWVKRRVCS